MATLEDYEITDWENGSGEPINSTNLDNIEFGIDRVTKATQVNEDKLATYQAREEFPPPLSTDVVLGGIKHRVDIDATTGDATLYMWTDTSAPA